MNSEESIIFKIRAQVGSMIFIAALNLGFAFFENSIFIDVVIITLLAAIIYRWNSRVSSALLLGFAIFALYHLMSNFQNAGLWRVASIAWLVYASGVALYWTVKINISSSKSKAL